MTPARRYHQAAQAHAAAQQSGEMDLTQLSEYQRLLLRLKTDKAALKNISGMQDKAAAKAEMLPAYAGWVQGVISGGVAQEGDQITPTVLIWQIDCGQLDEMMPLARFAIDSGMAATDDYSRSLPEIIIEETAEQISRGHGIAAEHLAELLAYATDRRDNGQHRHNMPDEIRAKLLKAAGEQAEEQGDIQTALSRYQAALDYNPRAGVKNRIAALEKQLAAEQQTSA